MRRLMTFVVIMLAASSAARAQAPAGAGATLVQTIDLGTWNGTLANFPMYPLPATFTNSSLFLQVPQPPPGTPFSLTGIAVDPVINTVYVADHASSNVYLIDGTTNTVKAATYATYTYGLYGNIDGVVCE
jgi:DNA-binding beta-propeller fold protein YncE